MAEPINVRGENLLDSIHHIEPKGLKDKGSSFRKKHVGIDETEETMVYCFTQNKHDVSPNGYPMLVDDWTDPKKPQMAINMTDALAAQSSNGDRYSFYIKIGPGGLYNPISLTGNVKTLNRGVETYKWTKVESECFVNYLKFLTTKNVAFLNTASRSL